MVGGLFGEGDEHSVGSSDSGDDPLIIGDLSISDCDMFIG